MTKLSDLTTDQLLDKCCDFMAQKGIEDCLLIAYLCSAGKTTIGIGLANKYPSGNPIKLGDTCTREEAYTWCKAYILNNCYKNIIIHELCIIIPSIKDVETAVALISISYNTGRLGPSIIAAILKPVLDKQELAAAFRKYIYFTNPKTGKKEISQGLVNRREKEIKYFMEIK